MRTHLHPLLSALQRNPTGAVLVTLQVAITLAVLVNAAAMVGRAITRIAQPSGLDTSNTFVMVIGGITKQFNVARAVSADLAYLRSLPDVTAATVTTGVPLTSDGFQEPLGRRSDGHGTTVAADLLPVDEQGLRALDVPLVAGRNFRTDEVAPQSSGHPFHDISSIIVTQSVARALFPHGHALGGTVYINGGQPLTIIGITRDFMGPHLSGSAYNTVLLPTIVTQFGFYDLLVRTRPGTLESVLHRAKRHIGATHANGMIVYTPTLTGALRRLHAGQRNLVVFLAVITSIMLTFCCFGIFGLNTFNVGSRTKQIGIRRAVGARKGDIVAHFMLENAIVLTAGLLLGALLSLAIGQWLTRHDGMPRLGPAYLLAGMLVLGLVAQLAAWQPARRAARVPPSVATRTV